MGQAGAFLSSLPIRPRPRTRVATSRSGCSHRFTGRLFSHVRCRRSMSVPWHLLTTRSDWEETWAAPCPSPPRQCSRRTLRTGCARHNIVSARRAVAALLHMWHFTSLFFCGEPSARCGHSGLGLSARAAAQCEAGTRRAGCHARRRGQHGSAFGAHQNCAFFLWHLCTPTRKMLSCGWYTDGTCTVATARRDQVHQVKPASRGTEEPANVLRVVSK